MITIIQKNLPMSQKMCTFAVPKEEKCNVATLHRMATSNMYAISVSFTNGLIWAMYLSREKNPNRFINYTYDIADAELFDSEDHAYQVAIDLLKGREYDLTVGIIDLDDFERFFSARN